MSLDIQIGALGAEKFNLEIHKNTHWKKYFFFHEKRLRRVYGNWILDPLSSADAHRVFGVEQTENMLDPTQRIQNPISASVDKRENKVFFPVCVFIDFKVEFLGTQ